jgi:uncharacterized protein (DUF1800 family)
MGALRPLAPFARAVELEDLAGSLAKMGQRLFYPPTVAGWPTGMAWLRGSTLLARTAFASTFADAAVGYGPKHLQSVAERNGWKDAEEAIDGFASLLLGATLPPMRREELVGLCRGESDPNRRCGRLVCRMLALAEAHVC